MLASLESSLDSGVMDAIGGNKSITEFVDYMCL